MSECPLANGRHLAQRAGVLTMVYVATTSPSGWTNNTEVRCSGCGAKLYVRPNDAQKMGGWECPQCHKRH